MANIIGPKYFGWTQPDPNITPVDVGQLFFNKCGLFGWFVNDTMSQKPGFYFCIIYC